MEGNYKKNKFKNSNILWTTPYLLKYSNYDFQLNLQNNFEDFYVQNVNYGYKNWKLLLMINSITYNTIPITGDYWKIILYNIAFDTVKEDKNKIIKRNELIFTRAK